MEHPKKILNTLEIRAKKSLSQNFLVSSHWAEKMVDLCLEAKDFDEVWEVGPGLGALTEHLFKRCEGKLKVFELDRDLCVYLKERFEGIELVEGDFIKADIGGLLGDKKISFVYNLPYKISSPVLFELAPYQSQISRMILTFQKEFGERLIAKVRETNYSALTVIIQHLYAVEKVGTLSGDCFFPKPEVESIVLKLTPKAQTQGVKDFVGLVKAAFSHRRKKLSKNLLEFFKTKDTKAVEAMISSLGHSPLCRAEELTAEEFEALLVFAKRDSLC